MSINDRAVRRTGRSGKRAGKKGADDPAVAEQHFQLALRSAPVVLFTHDADLRYTWVSGPGTGPELLGKTDLELSDLHAAESAERIVEFKLEVLKGGKGARRDVGVIIAGQQRVIDLSVEPIRDAEGQIIGISGAAIDVTEQRESKEATASRQKDEFLAVLAHELRNPLAPIRGAVQLLRLLGSSVPDKGLAIEVIDRQVDTLARLVDDLLDVSRFTRGKVALRKELLEVSSTIQRAIETTLPLIHARGQTLSVSLSNEPLYVEGDSTRLEQVFCNLLNNAAKFMPQGGRIEVSCRRTEGQAAVMVEGSRPKPFRCCSSRSTKSIRDWPAAKGDSAWGWLWPSSSWNFMADELKLRARVLELEANSSCDSPWPNRLRRAARGSKPNRPPPPQRAGCES
jgi:PAS domain S-box-containing protein